MEIRGIRTPGLGDATYVLGHRGVGLVVDPQRDIARFQTAAQELGVEIRYVLETHVHNDYISGGRQLAAISGAQLILPAGSGVAYQYVPAFHCEDLPGEGGLTIRPIHTPGHTPEHVSYLVLIDGLPVALFSGGSLLVGSAGRPDLLGLPRARQLARLQYQSLQRLAKLPDALELFPTHGEGSFCAASAAGRSTSTIGDEKRQNALLAHDDPERFADAQLAALGPYPRYYAQMGPINTLGPTALPERSVPELTAAEILSLGSEVRIVDGRPRAAFAAGHLAGALGIELARDFGTWAGFVLPFNAPLTLVLDPEQDLDEALVQLARIGYDDVRGVFRGMADWPGTLAPLVAFETLDVDRFARAVAGGAAPKVLDVRTPAEWADGHLAGSVHRFVADLVDCPPAELEADEQLWIACGSGYRASLAASLLQQAGYRRLTILDPGGVADVLEQLRAAAIV